jgi:hypothetical protein
VTPQEIIDIGNDVESTTAHIDAAALALALLGREHPTEGERVWHAIYIPGQARMERAWLEQAAKRGRR